MHNTLNNKLKLLLIVFSAIRHLDFTEKKQGPVNPYRGKPTQKHPLKQRNKQNEDHG